jgi:hypothetical protein
MPMTTVVCLDNDSTTFLEAMVLEAIRRTWTLPVDPAGVVHTSFVLFQEILHAQS